MRSVVAVFKGCVFIFLLYNMSAPLLFAQQEPQISFRIYGAEWCSACHHLQAALAGHGWADSIPYRVDSRARRAHVEYVDIAHTNNQILSERLNSDQSLPEVQIRVNDHVVTVIRPIRSWTVTGGADVNFNLFTTAAREAFRQAMTMTPARAALGLHQRRIHRRPASVILAATGFSAEETPLSSAYGINHFQSELFSNLHFPRRDLTILYGRTPSDRFDAMTLDNHGRQHLTSDVQVHRDGPLTRRNLLTALARPVENTLLVITGHGYDDGIHLRGSRISLSPDNLSSLIQSNGSNTVILSGGCHSGIFSRVGTCGFFAARPDTLSSGCIVNQNDLRHFVPRDYTANFIRSLSDPAADTNHDGSVSFEEAHFYASIHNIYNDATYTSIDALADRYFDSHGSQLPASIRLEEIERLREFATPAEAAALQTLITNNRCVNRADGRVIRPHGLFLRETSIPFHIGPVRGRFNIVPFRRLHTVESMLRYNIFGSNHEQIGTAHISNDQGLQNLLRPYLPATDRDNAQLEIFEIHWNQSNRPEFYLWWRNPPSRVLNSLPGGQWPQAQAPVFDNPSEILDYTCFVSANFESHYQPALVQLVRRLVFKRSLHNNPEQTFQNELMRLQSCEQQNVRQFLGLRPSASNILSPQPVRLHNSNEGSSAVPAR